MLKKIWASGRPCQIQRNVFHRNHTQLSKLSFTNIEPNSLECKYKNLSETNKDINKTEEMPIPSMSRISLDSFFKDCTPLKQINQLPSWYERLSLPSSYRIDNDIIHSDTFVPYRSFQRCYSRELAAYTETFISLTKPQMRILQAKFPNQDLPEHVQQQYIKIDAAVKKLCDLSKNTYIMHKRLKIARYTPPFYLHQQFLIHLGDKNIAKLLDLYFDFPKPRPLYLKREEFEKFMSLLLSLKLSGDHKFLLNRIVEVYEDIRNNGCGINLTPFEDTKYLSILLILWKHQGIQQDEKFQRIIDLKNDPNPKKRLEFCPAMWNIMISHFPEKVDDIMKMISNEMGITRTISEVFLKHLKTFNEFSNALELMRLKHFHLDPLLLNIIIEKYIEFGKSKEAFHLISEIIKVFDDISLINWIFLTQKEKRTCLFRFDTLNKCFQQLSNQKNMPSSQWIRYKFKPDPIVLGQLALSLDVNDRCKLLKLMIKQNIPLVNKHALQLLENKDFKTLPLVLSLTNESRDFNKNLHRVSKDAKYDTSYYSKFIHESTDSIFELKEIFRKGIHIYDDFADIETANDIKTAAAEQIVKLNEEIKGLQ
jgi:hypothetical protein